MTCALVRACVRVHPDARTQDLSWFECGIEVHTHVGGVHVRAKPKLKRFADRWLVGSVCACLSRVQAKLNELRATVATQERQLDALSGVHAEQERLLAELTQLEAELDARTR